METKLLNPNKMHEVRIVYKRPIYDSMPIAKNSNQAYEVFKSFIDFDTLDYKESFYLLLLTQTNSVLNCARLGVGDTAAVCVNIKEVFQLALMSNASGIILCHNHPSGKLNCSKADKVLTEKVKLSGQLISIQLVDHIIITSEGYYSLGDNEDILIPDNTLPF